LCQEEEVEDSEFEPGQPVWIEGRRAILLELNTAGSPIVRFEGEHVTRVVPMRKLEHLPPEERRPANGAA
jgi:hypothetical protein